MLWGISRFTCFFVCSLSFVNVYGNSVEDAEKTRFTWILLFFSWLSFFFFFFFVKIYRMSHFAKSPLAIKQCRIIIRNLAFTATEKDIRKEFIKYGPIKSIHLPQKEGSSRITVFFFTFLWFTFFSSSSSF